MSSFKISRRYAKSLLITAKERGLMDVVAADLELVRTTGEASRDLRAMLRSPIIDVAIKKSVLRDAIGSKINALTLDFMNLVLDKGRGGLWREITLEYRNLLDDEKNIERVRVTSAVELDAPERSRIEDGLSRRLGKTIVATYDLDPTILGGAVVRVGDQVLDGSLRHQLGVLKEKLAGA
jgi:F-type H+-transporting ATPase subunit delta